jgi:3-oxo-4,17-pregnadiene-20-carboxyl-CoA hydratase alpha subunit
MPLTPDEKRELERRMQEFVGKPIGPPVVARDPVNEPMIRQWCDAMGDRNPIYWDAEAARRSAHGRLVAPPTMLQAWTMAGWEMHQGYDEPRNNEHRIHKLLSDHGYTAVVATNTEQAYTRYLVPGDVVTAEIRIERVSEEKATALGIGYFIDTRTTFTDADGKELGWMTFRVLKFIPQQQPKREEGAAAAVAAKPARLRPPLGHDNAPWWERVGQGKIPIQKCNRCGALHHPPRPMCGECGGMDMGYVESSGRGTVHTFTVIHYPQFPGYEFPIIAVLVDLEEGTRLMSNLVEARAEDVRIGMRVQGFVQEGEDGLALPVFRPA